jgi:hypothetical protein
MDTATIIRTSLSIVPMFGFILFYLIVWMPVSLALGLANQHFCDYASIGVRGSVYSTLVDLLARGPGHHAGKDRPAPGLVTRIRQSVPIQYRVPHQPEITPIHVSVYAIEIVGNDMPHAGGRVQYRGLAG